MNYGNLVALNENTVDNFSIHQDSIKKSILSKDAFYQAISNMIDDIISYPRQKNIRAEFSEVGKSALYSMRFTIMKKW